MLTAIRSRDREPAWRLLNETARHLALWMSYEDIVRVADLKTRRQRFERVRGEVRLRNDQMLQINEFLHPRVEEIADTLPSRLGRWLLNSDWARALVLLNVDSLDDAVVGETLSVILKYEGDIRKAQQELREFTELQRAKAATVVARSDKDVVH